ncbi:hypothetical protein [Litoreibacter janthinus]|uniref:YdhG-like domain-containing protein n=1 Tax=Litoreibacter janthinus TaxID=670154 RepID=A0A1I6HKR3_9RHOB|nr:hypothetical protein [Litoreibacter janthinus]SFR55035.1 hypothetical protein SAMN04488002_3117 [Litoreibacter janthinus]
MHDRIPTEVSNVFDALPPETAEVLRATRLKILTQAAAADGVGPLTETLKWGEPAYLTNAPKTGTTIRLGQIGGAPAMMVPCSTTIIEDARAIFGDLPDLSGKRGLILGGASEVLYYVIDAALCYHLRKCRAVVG